MAVSGLPKLDDIKNAVTKAKSALAKYNSAKGSLKSLEDGINNLKSILNDESNKLKNIRNDYENKTYLNVDSYNTVKDTYNKSLENYKNLKDILDNRKYLEDSSEYKSARDKYNSAYSFLNSNKWFEESDAYKATLDKSGKANDAYNKAVHDYDNVNYLKQNSGYQDLLNNLRSSQEIYNKAKEKAENENYLRDNSDYDNKRNTFNEAQNKLNDLDNWKNSGRHLNDNGGYQDALREIENKRNGLREAENRMDNAEIRSGSSWDSLVNKKIEAERAFETAQSNANKKREEADRDANTKVQNQGQTRDNAERELNRVRQESEQKANTARENAEKNYNTLREKEENTRNQYHDNAQRLVDTTRETRDSIQSEADKAKDVAKSVAQANVESAERAMGTIENKLGDAFYPKVIAARDVSDVNGSKLSGIADTLSSAAYKNVEAQDNVVAQKSGLVQTAENKYNENLQGIEPDLQTYNAYANDVVGYAKQFRENLADISSASDVTAAKSLFGEFNKLIDAGEFTDDVKSKITPHFDGIEFKGTQVSTPETPASAKARQLALQGGDASLFSNIDPTTGLPLLNRDKFDSIVARYGNNVKGNGKARAAFAQEGWNMMSDSALLLQGPAILGLSTGTYMDLSAGGIGNYKTGIVNSKGQEATNADYLTAAKQIGLDGDSYTMPIKFVPAGYAYGQVEKPTAANSAEYTNPRTGETYLARVNPKTKEFDQALDTKALYADIAEKTKDLYYVANAIENVGANKATPHAGILYKANESGVLTPVLNEKNEPIVNYYEGERVHHAGASGQLAELMPLIQMAAMVFAPQLGGMLNSAIGGIQVSAAVAPTAFTMGLPAVTLAQTIGATGVSMLSGAIQNMVTSGLTGGDIGQAALTGAVGPALAGNSTQLLNRVGIDQSKVEAIARATNTSSQQVTNMLANAVTVGVTGAVLGDPNALENAATSLAGQYVGTQAQNLVYDAVKGADPKVIAATVNAAGNVSNIATQTLINGGDVAEALKNAAPAIITGAARAGEAAGKVDGPGTATIVERSRYPEPTPDKSDLITLRSPELSSDTPTEIKDMIYSAYADPSVKIDVAQAMPVTAENIQQLTRAAQEKVAQSMLQAAANDPLYARSVTTESSIQALRQAGMYTLADGLVGIASMVTPGNIGQNTNEDQIMAEKMKQFLSPIADGTYDYTKKLSPVEVTAQYNVPELFTKILPGESISKDGQLILQDGKGSGLYVDKSGTLYDQYGNPAVQNFVPPNVTPLVAPEYTSTVPTILPNTTTAPVKNPAVPPSFVPYVLPTTIPITTPATTPTTTPTTTPATTPTTTPTTMPETVPTTAPTTTPGTETAPKTETVPKTETTPATQTVPKTETTAATQPAPVTKPITDLIPITPPVNAIPNTPVTTIPVTTPTTVTPNVPPVTPPVTPSVTPPVTTTTDNKSDITGVLAALAGAFGSGKVSTGAGGLGQVPAGYTAITTPLAKRPIGDLFPVSFTMMTPEEIAARSSTKIVRRGGLVSMRK